MDMTAITERFPELSKETSKGLTFVDLHGKTTRFSYSELMEFSRKFAGGLRKKAHVEW